MKGTEAVQKLSGSYDDMPSKIKCWEVFEVILDENSEMFERKQLEIQRKVKEQEILLQMRLRRQL